MLWNFKWILDYKYFCQYCTAVNGWLTEAWNNRAWTMSLRRKKGSIWEECEKEKEEEHREDKWQTGYISIQPTLTSNVTEERRSRWIWSVTVSDFGIDIWIPTMHINRIYFFWIPNMSFSASDKNIWHIFCASSNMANSIHTWIISQITCKYYCFLGCNNI